MGSGSGMWQRVVVGSFDGGDAPRRWPSASARTCPTGFAILPGSVGIFRMAPPSCEMPRWPATWLSKEGRIASTSIARCCAAPGFALADAVAVRVRVSGSRGISFLSRAMKCWCDRRAEAPRVGGGGAWLAGGTGLPGRHTHTHTPHAPHPWRGAVNTAKPCAHRRRTMVRVGCVMARRRP